MDPPKRLDDMAASLWRDVVRQSPYELMPSDGFMLSMICEQWTRYHAAAERVNALPADDPERLAWTELLNDLWQSIVDSLAKYGVDEYCNPLPDIEN